MEVCHYKRPCRKVGRAGGMLLKFKSYRAV